MQENSEIRERYSVNIKIAGKAGEGVMLSTKLLASLLQKLGLEIFTYYEYPSLIKGGHQTGQIYADSQLASCQKKLLDILILFDCASLKMHQAEINQDTHVIAEFHGKESFFTEHEGIEAKFVNCPLEKISIDTTGGKMSINVVANGLAIGLAGLKIANADLQTVISQEFADKEDSFWQAIGSAFLAGYNFALQVSTSENKYRQTDKNNILLTGNEALGLGALAGGLQFYSAYPMTPASGLLHFLASEQANFPLIVKHTEDEIGAINMAIGASYAGVKSMTGSAGGGFALMVESLSMLGVAEIPLVIVVGQRGAPGTGLPTWTSQADLQFVLRAGHGDFQRVVLTPGNVAEHFEASQKALYLAEKHQIPVIILSDKFILESYQTMSKPVDGYQPERWSLADNLPSDGDYKRYQLTDEGISTRSIPGQANGLALTNSYEHDEFGWSTEDATMVEAQIKKRQQKLVGIMQEIPQPVLLGPKEADYTLVGWGSTANVFYQLIDHFERNQQPLKINAIHLPCVWPFPKDKFLTLINQSKQTILVEGNSTGQLGQLIAQETGKIIEEKILRFDGRPFYVEDLLTYLLARHRR